MGGLGVMLRDDGETPTSVETYSSIKKAIKSVGDHFLCLDEIEIGCSEETTLAMVKFLNENLPKDSLGILIITHSRQVVQSLNHDHFFNLDGFDTKEEWLDRDVHPLSLDELKNKSLEFRRYVCRRTNEKK